MRLKSPMLALALLGAACAPALAQPSNVDRANYTFAGDVELDAPGFYDYLTVEGGRVYAAHYDRVTVFDVATHKVLGSIAPIKDAHGVVIVDRLRKGYVASGEDGVLKVFDLKDLHIVKEVKVADDVDGAVLDPHSGSVLAVAGDSKLLAVVNPDTDSVRMISLPGKPEYLAVDGAGKVYINLADKASIAKVDIASGRIDAVFPMAGCVAPHGIAFDEHTHRLFSGCSNGKMIVVDPGDGRNLASLPIGARSDGVVVDSRRGLAFSAGALGTLTIIAEDGGDRFSVARTIPTFFGGRNLTLDPSTGDIFVAHGDMHLLTTTADVLALRFNWDGASVAHFKPQR